jgi:transposase-like protein
MLEVDLKALLTFFSVPVGHRKKVRTTNVIERTFREVRQRTRPMSSFKNLASCDGVVFGLVST